MGTVKGWDVRDKHRRYLLARRERSDDTSYHLLFSWLQVEGRSIYFSSSFTDQIISLIPCLESLPS